MIIEVQGVDGEVVKLPRARGVVRDGTPNVACADVAGIEDLWLHVFEVPVHDEVVGQYLHNRVFVVRHAGEATRSTWR